MCTICMCDEWILLNPLQVVKLALKVDQLINSINSCIEQHARLRSTLKDASKQLSKLNNFFTSNVQLMTKNQREKAAKYLFGFWNS